MKKTIIILMFCICNFMGYSQLSVPQQQQPQSTDDLASNFSFSVGYGSHGIMFRGDLNASEILSLKLNNSSTRMYLDFSAKGYSFSRSTLTYNGLSYSSDANVISLGLGFGQEFLFNNFCVTPFIVVRCLGEGV